MLSMSSPGQAMKAGNRMQFKMTHQVDPIYTAYFRWNNELVLAGPQPQISEEPLDDNRAYPVEGSPQPRCRPQIKVAWRTGWLEGHEVRFEQRDDGMHLTAVFEEDQTRRPAGALPFDVRVKAVRLTYGSDATDVLNFSNPLQEPATDPANGPTFRVEVDTIVPRERQDRIVAALQARGGAFWDVTMEFEWIRLVPAPPTSPTPPVIIEPERPPSRPPSRPPIDIIDPRPPWKPGRPPTHPRIFRMSDTLMDAPGGPPDAKPRAAMTRPDALQLMLLQPVPQIAFTTSSTQEVRTLTILRRWAAEYPKDAPTSRPIYAAVTGDYAQAGWQSGPHGWFQPTPIQDTVYCLPDAYRLQVDEVTGLPSIVAVLMRKSDAGELIDDLDPKHYKTRITLKVTPDFDPNRLNSLRTLIRAQSTNQVKYADLVLGGYKGAQYKADDALAGLGELFTGSTAADRDTIDPAQGFTLTYEGNAEFIDLLFQRLQGEGFFGHVELDLNEPGDTTRKLPIPVILTLRRLAPLKLPMDLVQPASPGLDPAAIVRQLPREFRLRNSTGIAVTIGSVQAHALDRSPVTGRVDAWYAAQPEDLTTPLTLAAQESKSMRLQLESPDTIFNAWDVALVDCRPETSDQLVLSQLFDAATSGVRGWRIEVESPPLAFFDQLKPEEQESMKDIVGLEVEIKRLGSRNIEEVRLTRQNPRGKVLLSRTVADFIGDRATGRSQFEYRQRVLRLARAEDWSAWHEETGSSLTVYLA